MKTQLKKFSAEGTVLMGSLFAGMDGKAPPLPALKRAHAHRDAVVAAIEQLSGAIVQAGEDSVLAFWGPEAGHAQRALDAARAILELPTARQLPMRLVLGTGELAGDFTGPRKRFQITGEAVTLAVRLHERSWAPGPALRLSQSTVDLLTAPPALQPEEPLESLKVYALRPSSPA